MTSQDRDLTAAPTAAAQPGASAMRPAAQTDPATPSTEVAAAIPEESGRRFPWPTAGLFFLAGLSVSQLLPTFAPSPEAHRAQTSPTFVPAMEVRQVQLTPPTPGLDRAQQQIAQLAKIPAPVSDPAVVEGSQKILSALLPRSFASFDVHNAIPIGIAQRSTICAAKIGNDQYTSVVPMIATSFSEYVARRTATGWEVGTDIKHGQVTPAAFARTVEACRDQLLKDSAADASREAAWRNADTKS